MALEIRYRPGKPEASIVMLTHNDVRFLRDSLLDLFRHTRTPYELILVDNASRHARAAYPRIFAGLFVGLFGNGRHGKTSGLPALLSQIRIPQLFRIKVLFNRENRYFAGGNNQGIREAEADNVVLLNTDTWLGAGWLEGLLASARRRPRAGIVGPCTNSATGWQFVDSLPQMERGRFPAFSERWRARFRGQDRVVHRLTAFCWLIKRGLIERVGLLDERFKAGGYEDYDYCIRARLAGYQIVLAQDTFIYHLGGQGYSGMDYGALRARNKKILSEKYQKRMERRLSPLWDAAALI